MTMTTAEMMLWGCCSREYIDMNFEKKYIYMLRIYYMSKIDELTN